MRAAGPLVSMHDPVRRQRQVMSLAGSCGKNTGRAARPLAPPGVIDSWTAAPGQEVPDGGCEQAGADENHQAEGRRACASKGDQKPNSQCGSHEDADHVRKHPTVPGQRVDPLGFTAQASGLAFPPARIARHVAHPSGGQASSPL